MIGGLAALSSSDSLSGINLKSHQIPDANNPSGVKISGSIEAPADWQLEGGVHWSPGNPSDPYKVAYTVTSPDGKMAYEQHASDVWISSQSMSRPYGIGTRPTETAGSYLVRHFIPQHRRGAKIISAKLLIEQSQKLTAFAQKISSIPRGTWVDVATATIEYESGGERYQESIITSIGHTSPSPGEQFLQANTVSMRAPASKFEESQALFGKMLTGIKFDNDWLESRHNYHMKAGAKIFKDSRERLELAQKNHRKNMEMMDSIWETQQATYKQRDQSNDRSNRNILLGLTETEDRINPHTNQVDRVDASGRYHFVDEWGERITTDDPNYDPNRDPNYSGRNFRAAPNR